MNMPGTSSNVQASGDSERLDNIKTFILPGNSIQKSLGCVFRSGNQFTVYSRSQTTGVAGSGVSDGKIMNIRQEVMLFTPILRKLVNESNGTFIALQKAAEASKNSDNQVELLKLSRQYRSIVRVCIESLQEAAGKETDKVEKNNLLSYITIFYSIECIWHLCEILYIDNIPGDVVLPYILEWVRFHFPSHEQTAAQLLEACERGSEDHPEYWDTVVGMVVQGRVDVARALLKLHSQSESNEFKLVDNSLRTMPVYSVYGGISTGEFQISWKHWQAECRSKLTSRSLASQPQLELIIRLVIGDYTAFESIRDKYDSWFDLVGGWLLFSAPWGRRRELAAAACACAGLRPRGVTRTSALDHLVRALTEGDLHQVVHEIQQFSDGGWCATHLTDILFHCGKLASLDGQPNNTAARLRDALILEYGGTLLEHRSLWAAGLSYLCAGAGAGAGAGAVRAAALLQRLPLGSEARAMRLWAEAKRHGLAGVEKTISSCMSARQLRGGRLGAALAWAVRARSSQLAARAADAALRRYVETGVLPAVDLLLTVGPNMLLCDRLVFLSKYCEFHRMYKSREFKAAGQLLVALLTSKITPDYFWETLLLDTLPLLECDEPILSSEATCEAMALLESRAKGLCGEKADLLRLALVRNLAKAALAPDDE